MKKVKKVTKKQFKVVYIPEKGTTEKVEIK